MKEEASTSEFLLHAWCLMPDHLHILTEGVQETSDLFAFVSHFKRRIAALCRRPVWQRNFYEHIVRNGTGLERIASYIWMNPVRRGLCEFVNEYPFSGSLTMPWQSAADDPWIPPWKEARADGKKSAPTTAKPTTGYQR